jgi:hypothetical protein
MAAYAFAPPPVSDTQGGGGVGYSSVRSVALKAEKLVCGLFGGLLSCMLLTTGEAA